uniref:Uncharacterized protein n=1 Tax=Timema monikensis TaxID=170555 RepID=A0A7R9E515_9NEOP|nr:unnamed protein product [Timema monikensis]
MGGGHTGASERATERVRLKDRTVNLHFVGCLATGFFFPLLLLTLGPGFVASAARRRPPPIHDISIDVDEDREVDVREHDWRFQFKHHSEEEEDGADTQPEVASARLQTTQTRVVGDDGFITTVTTVTQQRESPDNSDLQELLDKLAQEKH